MEYNLESKPDYFKDYFEFLKMGANSFLIGVVITNQGELITIRKAFLLQIGQLIQIDGLIPTDYSVVPSKYFGCGHFRDFSFP